MKNNVGRNERMYQKGRRREALTIIAYLLCIALILGGIIVLVNILSKDESEFDDGDLSAVEYKGEKYNNLNNLDTVLFIGYDDYSDKEDSPIDFDQSDFLFLLVVDKANGRYSTIHIDRDTMADVWKLTSDGKKASDEKENMQIALSYAYGGGDVKTRSANTINAVTDLLNGDLFMGRRVNHYVAFGMDSVGALNKAVGGVEVEVPYDIGDLKKTAEGEKVKLTDEQALNFVRARQTTEEPTNESRMARQRLFIEAFIEQFGEKAANDEDFIKRVVEDDLASKVVSDDLTRVAEIAADAIKLETSGILTLEGEHKSDGEHMCFYPDKDKLAELVLSVFYKKVG